MASRLELVLRAGRAAETGPLAGNLTEFGPGDGRNDPSSPGMQQALEVAGEIEERNREQREREWRLQRRVEAENRARRQRQDAYKDHVTLARKDLEETERREKRMQDAYDRGRGNMRAAIREAQFPVMRKMALRLGHIQGVTRDDNEELNDLQGELAMLKSALDLDGPDYHWRPPEAALFDHP